MARYIDADKLLKEFEVDTSKDVMDISDIVFGAVTSIIEKQPTADVVEVVRCKDCCYFTEGMAVGMCKRVEDKPIIPCCFDHYCSYGERRDT